MSPGASATTRRFASPTGTVVRVNRNGSIRRMDCGAVVLNLFPASEVEGGPANLYLRRLDSEIAWTPLLGPRSPLTFDFTGEELRAVGEWRGIQVELSLSLASDAPAWFWHVRLENGGAGEIVVDLLHAQDIALAHYDAVRTNEYYVSQYLDHVPLEHPARGTLLAVRQNLSMSDAHPWALIGSLGCGVSFATDALQLHGLATRAGLAPAGLVAPRLPGRRHQHEHAMAVIQDEALRLAPGESSTRGFFGWFEADHPAATSDADLAAVDRALALSAASAPASPFEKGGPRGISQTNGAVVASLFSSAPLLQCRDLSDAEIAHFWGGSLRHVERDGERMLSFFTGAHTHVVLRAKEMQVLRPHGEILRTGGDLIPDEASLTTTAWMAGVFNSLTTQGHVGINRLLSATRSYLGLQRAQGQRLFVELDGHFHLLDVPSAWEVTPSHCRWLYAHTGGLTEVRLAAPTDRHVLELSVAVLDGAPARFVLSSHVALNGDDGAEDVPLRFAADDAGVVVRPVPGSDLGRRFPDGFFRLDWIEGAIECIGGDELLYEDRQSRNEPFLVAVTAPATALHVRLTGGLVAPRHVGGGAEESDADSRFWAAMSGPLTLAPRPESRCAPDVERLQDILPWFAHDALIHYLAPRGLEQFSGGGWGTRDVCQGPVELLLALGRWEPVRELLLRVFANQNPDGDWPQWFMFFERERAIRPSDSHGDVVFWPLLALAEYLLASEDDSILAAEVPFFAAEGDDGAQRASVWEHVERALAVAQSRVVPGTRLPAYGNGDWNDSLQPTDAAMRERLCSTWTATLHHQTLATLAAALHRLGRDADAKRFDALAAEVRSDFHRWLIADGELAGFAYLHGDGRVEYLLHPGDRETGIHHRLLPMIHAILADLLSREQAAAHVALMREHLLGVDGARLFDRPPEYRGGPPRYFQRAETSTFFGREIGLMYMHAHLRYAEAMARWGDADAFFDALRRADPIAIDEVVPAARRRQANCYYSSSDAVVADRYEGAERYPDICAGRVALEGGWRIYSSGAGIAIRLIHQCFLGLRRGRSTLGIDPVIPKALDGLRVQTEIDGREVGVLYRIAALGRGPVGVTLNGQVLPTTRMANPYRTAGVAVAMADVRRLLRPAQNQIVVDLE